MTMKGRKHSVETRAKMSARAKGRVISKETREALSAKLKGRALPPDAPQRRRGRITSENTKEKLRGQHLTEEQKIRHRESLKGHVVSDETREKIRAKLLGHAVSEKTREKIAAKISPIAKFIYRGGRVAEEFAAVLCPAGFIREHHVLWGKGNERFILDFAHLEGRVNIELDGPTHNDTQEADALRDTILKLMGWRIIRINVRGW